MSHIVCEVDQISEADWSRVIDQFADANLYQTWAHGALRWGEKNLSHLVLRRDGDILGAAQVQMKKIPLLGGIADIAGGPMWRPKSKEKNLALFREMLKALYGEYALKRGMYLRVRSEELFEDAAEFKKIFEEEHYRELSQLPAFQTLLVDLRPDLAEVRKNLKYRWRRHLNKAEKFGQQIRLRRDNEALSSMKSLFEEMRNRKNILDLGDFDIYCAIQQRLPENQKMTAGLCEKDGEILACNVWSNIGERGILHFRINGHKALEFKSAYLLSWSQIEDNKKSGLTYYDEAGYEEDSPGDAFFKSGLNGQILNFLPHYVACKRPWLRAGVSGALWLREKIKEVRTRIKRKFRPKKNKEEVTDSGKEDEKAEA